MSMENFANPGEIINPEDLMDSSRFDRESLLMGISTDNAKYRDQKSENGKSRKIDFARDIIKNKGVLTEDDLIELGMEKRADGVWM